MKCLENALFTVVSMCLQWLRLCEKVGLLFTLELLEMQSREQWLGLVSVVCMILVTLV